MKPNLFIVGAGKAGTFALYEYLNKHPDVYMSANKEPNYFGGDLKFNQPRLTSENYLALFSGADKYSYRGEASVSYLLSKSAADEIKSFNDKSKIIIIVRDPIEVMYSRHGQNLKAGIETIRSFGDALAVEPDRRKGSRIPTGVTCEDWLYYTEWVKYSEQIDRYLASFSEENVFLAVYDDLKMNPEGLYCNLMQFLGLSTGAMPRFEKVNSHKKVRSTFVTRVSRGKVRFWRQFGKVVLPNKALRKALRVTLDNLNSVEEPRPPLSRELEYQLRKEMEPEVLYLERLLGRNLSHWKGQRSIGQER